MNKPIYKLLGCAAILAASTNANALNIDLFSIDQTKLVSTSVTGTQSSSVTDLAPPPNSILGTERDLSVTLLNDGGVSTREASIGVAGGVLDFSTDTLASGTGSITWDGVDGAPGVNTTGLGGSALYGDLTLGGTANAFTLTTLFSDGNFLFNITAWNFTTGGKTVVTLLADPVALPGTVSTISFDAFNAGLCNTGVNGAIQSIVCTGGGSNGLNNLGALQVNLDPFGGSTSIDLTIDSIVVNAPEPTAMALLGIGLLGAGFKRYSGKSKLAA